MSMRFQLTSLLSVLVAGAACATPAPARAQDGAACAAIADDAKRLACYDALYRPATPVAAPVAAASAPARSDGDVLAEVATAPSGRGLAADDYLTKFWELDPASRRGTFVVRTYSPNFLLPAHYTTSVNKSPTSPTHPDGGDYPSYQQTEAELQVSLRAKAFEDVLLPGADIWLAYTQRSIWQLWNAADSSPFRSSDYQPEGMIVVPIPDDLGTLPRGWRWRMAMAGIAHESNGQSDPLSRSWNRLYLDTRFTHDDLAIGVRYDQRLPDSGVDDNPRITDFIGNTELSASWYPGETTMQLTARTSFKSWSTGSLQFEWTHPVFKKNPDGLRWYVQLFSGYGETLLDYNHRQTSLGLGFTLFQL